MLREVINMKVWGYWFQDDQDHMILDCPTDSHVGAECLKIINLADQMTEMMEDEGYIADIRRGVSDACKIWMFG